MNNKVASLMARHCTVSAALLFSAACSTLSDSTPIEAAPSVAASSPVYVLSDVAGASPQMIDALLGSPSLTRREGNGEYRRYDLSTCALIIILYPDEVGTVRTAHIDTAALNAGGAKPDLDQCLAAG